jgi:uncharacterized membrane protein HdeD (DUF308 family)
MIETFLTGAIVALSGVAALFFLKFWRRTADGLFLAFAIAFAIEAVNRARFLMAEHPNEGSASIYAVRLLAFTIILAAIVARNLRSGR